MKNEKITKLNDEELNATTGGVERCEAKEI